MPISTFPMKANRTGSWRYLTPYVNQKIPPCESSCPLSVPISDFIRFIECGDIEKAGAAILEENPFPSICGRICVHPCEDECNRALFDRSLAIHMLERYAGDSLSAGLKNNKQTLRKKIAIIGAGPSGLSAAYFLLRMGYSVTIFDANSEPGGILRYGIPEYRLPEETLKKALNTVFSFKPEFKPGHTLGKNLTFDELKSFDAVFLGVGAQTGKVFEIENEGKDGIISGIDILKRIKNKEYAGNHNKAVIIGGGNTAIDVARSLLRLGKKPVILYRRDFEDMPAFAQEAREALREGIEIETRAIAKEILKEGDSIAGVKCVKVEHVKNRLADFNEINGSLFIIETDIIISAIGEAPDISILPAELKCKNGKVAVDQFGRTSLPNVFAGGDLIDRPHLVVHALASGKEAAVSIDASFNNFNLSNFKCSSQNKYLESDS